MCVGTGVELWETSESSKKEKHEEHKREREEKKLQAERSRIKQQAELDEQRKLVAAKRVGIEAGMEQLDQSRAGLLVTSPLGEVGYQKLGKRTLLGV